MAKKKYYAVKRGKTPGIYLTWEDCRSQISGFSGAVYKGFETLEEAGAFLQQAGRGPGRERFPAAGSAAGVQWCIGCWKRRGRGICGWQL